MPLTVQVFPKPSDKQTREEELAYQLKELFESQLPGAHGKIAIHANVLLYGFSATYREVDLLVLAHFEPGLTRRVNTPTKLPGESVATTAETVVFHNICWVIEAKEHRSFEVSGDALMVTYNKKRHNVSAQSDGQKNGVRNLFEHQLHVSMTPTNLIWLPGLSRQQLPSRVPNVIGKDVTILDMLAHVCRQKFPIYHQSDQAYHSSSSSELSERNLLAMESAIEQLSREEIHVGLMTRRRLEKITKTLLKDQQYATEIGKRLVVLRGRAGTGKTVKLLSIAHDLAKDQRKDVKILTYNKALVSDIRRLCALLDIDNTLEGRISVDTVHSTVLSLAKMIPLIESRQIWNFLKHYGETLETIVQAIESGLLNESEQAVLRASEFCQVDYVMVDEAQDWPELERRLLMSLFSPAQIIIADGIDQMVRGNARTPWEKDLKPTEIYYARPERRSLRQESNLGRFVASYCSRVGLPWDVLPNDDVPGGRVIIKIGQYTKSLHTQLYKDCVDAGNLAYEMLFMVPPSMVAKETDDTGASRLHFKFAKKWEKWGIKLWDGTMSDNRTQYPNDVDQHRLLQYESCRGLEGWTAVCLSIDQLFEWKRNQWVPVEEELPLLDRGARQERFGYQWCVIPFTRAIDTLVLTIDDINSPIVSILRDIYEKSHGIVEWHEDS